MAVVMVGVWGVFCFSAPLPDPHRHGVCQWFLRWCLRLCVSLGMQGDLGCEVVPLVVRATPAVHTACSGMEERQVPLDERQQSLFLWQTCPTTEL